MEFDLWEGIAEPKKSILKAALQVFAEKGYGGAATREIAKAAGVADGLVFYHFKDKQTLFGELARHLRGVIAKALLEHQNTSGDFYEQVEGFIEQKLRLYAGYPDLYRFFMLQIRQFPDRFDEDSREVRSIYPVWPGSDHLAHEILESALNGMTTQLIEQFQSGVISAEAFVEKGLLKSKRYIAFFRELDILEQH